MKTTFKLSLKANERLYINGAVVRFDRKTSIEFLNDVSFLHESHVMQLEDANTRLKKLYYVVQIMLMSPDEYHKIKDVFRATIDAVIFDSGYASMSSQIKAVDHLVHERLLFEAMRAIRAMFASEALMAAGTMLNQNTEAEGWVPHHLNSAERTSTMRARP